MINVAVLELQRRVFVDPIYEASHDVKMLRVKPPRGAVPHEDKPNRLDRAKAIFYGLADRRCSVLLCGT